MHTVWIPLQDADKSLATDLRARTVVKCILIEYAHTMHTMDVLNTYINTYINSYAYGILRVCILFVHVQYAYYYLGVLFYYQLVVELSNRPPGSRLLCQLTYARILIEYAYYLVHTSQYAYQLLQYILLIEYLVLQSMHTMHTIRICIHTTVVCMHMHIIEIMMNSMCVVCISHILASICEYIYIMHTMCTVALLLE